MATIKVRLKDASKNVLHPETDWSVVKNSPAVYDKAYALDKPDYLDPDPDKGTIVLGRMGTRVSFGLIEIDGGNKKIQSFYIVAAEQTDEGSGVGSSHIFTTKQVLYYLKAEFSDTTGLQSVWSKPAINYSESTTTYSYIEGGTAYKAYLTPLLKAAPVLD